MKSAQLLKEWSNFFQSTIARNSFARHAQKLKICSFNEESRKIRAEYKLSPEDCNQAGSASKGLITLISDVLIGSTCVVMTRPNGGSSTLGINIKFLGDAKAGEVLDIEINHCDTKPNKDLVTVTMEIMNRNKGTLIAVGTQTQFIKQVRQ